MAWTLIEGELYCVGVFHSASSFTFCRNIAGYMLSSEFHEMYICTYIAYDWLVHEIRLIRSTIFPIWPFHRVAIIYRLRKKERYQCPSEAALMPVAPLYTILSKFYAATVSLAGLTVVCFI